MTLSSTTPMPVSSTAILASGRRCLSGHGRGEEDAIHLLLGKLGILFFLCGPHQGKLFLRRSTRSTGLRASVMLTQLAF